MPARVANVTVHCADVLMLARFWSHVLGRPLDEWSDSGFASIGSRDADRVEPAWFFEHAAESTSTKGRLHVDLVDPDPGAAERLVELGATVVARHELDGGGHRWTVLEDPEGNEFCLAARSFTG